jgi:cytochrome c peroxidase
VLFDLGIAGRTPPDLPRYTLRNKVTRAEVRTSDPGRALVTGKWADVSRFKAPVLRNLAARPPYFHDGSAATLADVVEFYDRRFQLGLTAAERGDLVAFLSAL